MNRRLRAVVGAALYVMLGLAPRSALAAGEAPLRAGKAARLRDEGLSFEVSLALCPPPCSTMWTSRPSPPIPSSGAPP